MQEINADQFQKLDNICCSFAMSSDEHRFLFASLGSKQPLTTRQVHIRRLYDLLQLCIQRHDYERAKRAWAILARCKEVGWKSLWPTALAVMPENAAGREKGQVVEFLRMMMLQHPEEVRKGCCSKCLLTYTAPSHFEGTCLPPPACKQMQRGTRRA